MVLSFSFLIHLILKEVFLSFVPICFMFPFQQTNAWCYLEMLFISYKYRGPQEYKNNMLCKGRKKYADRGQYLWNEVEWCLCLVQT